MRGTHWSLLSLGASIIGLPAAGWAAPTVKLDLPLNRVAYQDNEGIELAVVRRDDAAALGPGTLAVTLTAAEDGVPDGSILTFQFSEDGAPLVDGSAQSTEHLRFDGRLLRPGTYAVQVSSDGVTAQTNFEVYSHLRKSSFRIGNWSARVPEADEQVESADGLGYNLFYGAADSKDNLIRSGIDFMQCCTMSGGHQMDLRSECDWSDPYVVQGGTVRVAHRALIDRTKPNAIGVHFYDEPGLTWWHNPDTGDWTPHGIPAQVRSYLAAFGIPAPKYNKLDPKDPASVAQWNQWARWKLGFMDAAWKDAKFGVDQVDPNFISVTQSQYGWSAFTDGYYFNVVRSLPVVSGHGGYDDVGPGYFTPSLFLEFARARATGKDNWYLPAWYGNTPADRMRVEQYLSFSTGIQGLFTPPDMDPYRPEKVPGAEAIVETNKAMARLGTIFTTMKPRPAPLAVLYSLSQVIHDQEADPVNNNYTHGVPHGESLFDIYVATKTIQQPFTAVLDEDVVDGTLAANHKAIILGDISYLDPKVVTGLKDFQAHGGKIIEVCGGTLDFPGAIKVKTLPVMPDADAIAKLVAAKKYNDLAPYQTVAKHLQAVAPFAAGLKTALEQAGVAPAFDCANTGIAANRQAAGDIDYLFAINTTVDATNLKENRLAPTRASITLAADKRPVYNALIGGLATEFKPTKAGLTADLGFGPGEMRVWARTARPIGGVKVSTPALVRDYTADTPLGIQVSASLLDATGGLLDASAPLEIKLIEPAGRVRYDLYRATANGVYRDTLPLALNDPAGTWTIQVTDLLAKTVDTLHFELDAATAGGAIAGIEHRAISFGPDRDRIFRMLRNHQDVTLVVGTNPFDSTAAQRLVETLRPWDVNATIMSAANAAKPRDLSADEAATWIGLTPGKAVPGDGNDPAISGFALRGPAVLIGTPEDNPLIKFIQTNRFLPYQPLKDEFPGRGRGYLAWQQDAIGHNQESATLIAYDEAGMAEAAGSFYEAVAGLEPVTATEPANSSTFAPANATAPALTAAQLVWETSLADRAVAITANGNGIIVDTLDGSESTLDATGKVVKTGPAAAPATAAQYATLPAALATGAWANHRVKWIAASAAIPALTAIGYWGGGLDIVGADGTLKTRQTLPQDITGLAWLSSQLAVGLADGQVVGLRLPASGGAH